MAATGKHARAITTLLVGSLHLSEADAEAWAQVRADTFGLDNEAIKTFIKAGYSPASARELLRELADSDRRLSGQDAARIVEAARFADLDPTLVPLWVRGGLMDYLVTSRGGRRRVAVSHHSWCTEARRWRDSVGGDEGLAALACSAGLTREEARAMWSSGELGAEQVQTLITLRGRLDG